MFLRNMPFEVLKTVRITSIFRRQEGSSKTWVTAYQIKRCHPTESINIIIANFSRIISINNTQFNHNFPCTLKVSLLCIETSLNRKYVIKKKGERKKNRKTNFKNKSTRKEGREVRNKERERKEKKECRIGFMTKAIIFLLVSAFRPALGPARCPTQETTHSLNINLTLPI
jgi:hypothetical protein